MGYFEAMTGPYLERLGASQYVIGSAFLLAGIAYVLSSPISGYICDKGYLNPLTVTIIGNIILCCGLLIIGPASILPIEPNLWLTIIGGILLQSGVSTIAVCTFSDIFKTALACGFQDNLPTYMGISGVSKSALYFGNFIGPTLAGFLVKALGFRCTGFIFALSILFMLALNILWKCKRASARSGYQAIDGSEEENEA